MMPRARVCSLRHGAAAVFLDNAGMSACRDEAEAESIARVVNRFDRRTLRDRAQCLTAARPVRPPVATDAAADAQSPETPLRTKAGGPPNPENSPILRNPAALPHDSANLAQGGAWRKPRNR
jgi:hypothetical protein